MEDYSEDYSSFIATYKNEKGYGIVTFESKRTMEEPEEIACLLSDIKTNTRTKNVIILSIRKV